MLISLKITFPDGNSVFYYIVKNKRYDILELLMEYGFDLEYKIPKTGENILNYTINLSDPAFDNYLLN